MEADFWRERWTAGRIGFHEGRPNTFLERYGAKLGGARRVLVPLCGKAEDLAYLAYLGHTVIGVELVEDAVKAFFAEHQITPTIAQHGEHASYTADPISIIVGDFFTTTRELLGPIDALYDRAAMIALPQTMRGGYVAHVRALVPAGSPALVVTLEYPQDRIDGPPFAVLEAELRAAYPGCAIDFLAQAEADNARIRDAGVTAIERCFALTL